MHFLVWRYETVSDRLGDVILHENEDKNVIAANLPNKKAKKYF